MKWLEEALLTWVGRLDRRQAIFCYIFIVFPAYLYLFVSDLLRVGWFGSDPAQAPSLFYWIRNIILVIVIGVPLSSIATRRIHDIGLTAKLLVLPLSLAFAISFIFGGDAWYRQSSVGPTLDYALLVTAALLVTWPGHKGENKFGLSRRKFA